MMKAHELENRLIEFVVVSWRSGSIAGHQPTFGFLIFQPQMDAEKRRLG